MPTQAEITTSVQNSPVAWVEGVLTNPDQTVTTPPQVAAGAAVATLITALGQIGVIEVT
jgi:hypothetical protein